MNMPQPEFDRFFGMVAPELRWVPSLRYLLRRKRILGIVARLPKGRLLEIGCGSGALLVDFARQGYTVTGVETSERAIDLARKMVRSSEPRIEVCASLDELDSARFDLVCSFDVLEHIKDDSTALASWAGCMKEGGRLLISVPAHSSRWGAGDIWAGHYRRYDFEPLCALLAEQGLSIEYVECYGFPLANLTEWLGKFSYRRKLSKSLRGSVDKNEATAASGVDREPYLKIFKYMNSFAGRAIVRAAYFLQWLFGRTRLGSGYIVLVSRK